MQVSVALATYNGAAHLAEQLASLAQQTLRPAELVVSDDGSTDNTRRIVEEFASVAPFPVTVTVNAVRLGFADNFLQAAERCRHDLVAFCDQDDVWHRGKLEACASRMQRDGSLVALHTLAVTDEALHPTGLYWTQGVAADRVFEPLQLDPYNNGWGNAMMFRRELVHLLDRRRRPPQPERNHLPLSHDTWVYVLGAALGRVSHVDAPLVLYRQHGGNVEGVAAAAPRPRLARFSDVPLLRIREQARINGLMVPLFREIAGGGGRLSDSAEAAARRFAERFRLRSARARMFEGTSLRARLRAWRLFHAMAAHPRPGLASRMKSLVLGVATGRGLARGRGGGSAARPG